MTEEKPVQNYEPKVRSAASEKAKSEETTPDKKTVEKIVSGNVEVRKKSVGRRILETFTGDDVHSVGPYLLFEVLVPAAKTLIVEIVTTGVERTLYGESHRPRGVMGSGSRVGYTNYNKISTRSETPWRRAESGRPLSYAARASHNFSEIFLDSRSEAEAVLDQLVELVDRHEVATVSDLYDMVGITPNFTDSKWGWTNLRDARVRAARGGVYQLDLPRPEQI